MKLYNCITVFITFYFCCAQLYDSQYEGDDCILNNDQKGLCVRLSQCPSAIEIVKNKQHPITCSYVKFIPIVCCPLGEKITTRLSEHKCNMYQNVKLKPIEEEHSTNDDVIKLNTNITDTSLPIISQKNSNINDNLNTTEEIFDFPVDIRSPNKNNTNFTIHSEYLNFSQFILGNIPESADPDIREIFNTNISWLNLFLINNTNNLTADSDNSIFSQITVFEGMNVLNGEFPHMAALGFSKDEKILWRCGGSLISEKFVLTAAHCLSSPAFGIIEWVSLGTSLVNINSDYSFVNPSQQIIKIIRRIPHPSYKRPATYNDIALVELERVVEFTINLKPACLQVSDDLNFQEQLIATGWGLTKLGGTGSENLLKVNLDVYSGEECIQIYENMAGTRRLITGIDDEVQMCAGSREGGEDTCSGDSGGPLQLKINDNNGPTYVLVGITSFGKACGITGIPGVYTRVSKYVPWIESIIWPDEF